MRSIFTHLSIAVGILLSNASFSQSVTQSWYRQISVPQNQRGPLMARDNSGNVYVAATYTASGVGSFYVMKYNAAGTQLWVNGYLGPTAGGVSVVAIAVDASGNVIVSGSGYDPSGLGAIVTAKFNPSGVLQWGIPTQAGLQYSSVNAITTDPAGNVFLVGSVRDNAYTDYLVVKLNANGVQQWVQKYNGSALNGDEATAVAADAAGNVYVTGISNGQVVIGRSRTNTGNDYVTIKYDPSGTVQWINRYYTTGGDQPSALVVDASGNVYITGYAGSTTPIGTTVAYSSTGAQLWVAQPSAAKFNTSIAKDASGNIFVSGYGLSSNQITFYTTKFSPAGAVLWTQSYTGGPIFYFDPKAYLAIDGSGNAYVTVPIAGNASNIATIKYSSSGVQSWVAIFNGPANLLDFATGLLTYQSSSPIGGVTYPSVYVCGISDLQSGPIAVGYVTLIKYTQSLTSGSKALAETSTGEQFQTAGQFKTTSSLSLSNYPNPYKSITNITYSLPHESHVLLQVYDAAGRIVAVPVNEHQPAGLHTQPFQSGRLMSGTYSYRILATSPQGTFAETKQMIVQ